MNRYEAQKNCPQGSFCYTIKSGDTLYKLAIKYNTTVEAIIAINPGIDPMNLQIGQKICIPGSQPGPTCPPGSFSYTIKSGDTLYKLAIQYNTTVEAIIAINPGIDPNNLQIGQKICIPTTGTTCPPGSFSYTIKSGDTLYKLAIQYNTTVSAIIAINPGIDPNNLQIGQKICIPGSGSTCPPGSFSYTIKSGDTLYKLAIEYNTTVSAIIAINPGIDPDNLQIGQKICIPETTPIPPKCPIGTFAYTIKPGDTIYMLAMRYNTTVEAILDVNPGLNPDNLQIGQVICIPRETPTPDCDGVYYRVRLGDTLYSISRMFNVPVADLIKANPGIDPMNLRVGELICIPKVTPPPKPCPGGQIYELKGNDNLVTVLVRFNISYMDLMQANKDMDIDNLKAGDKVCILPHMDWGCPCPRGSKSYRIMPQDIPSEGLTVVYLAQKFNTTVEVLMNINPNFRPTDFMVGKVICIPE